MTKEILGINYKVVVKDLNSNSVVLNLILVAWAKP